MKMLFSFIVAILLLTLASIDIDARGVVSKRSRRHAPARLTRTHDATNTKVIEIPDDQLLPATMKAARYLDAFSEIGHGAAIIITPDLAAPANRQFYQMLGFLYLEDTSWQVVLDQLVAYNGSHSDDPIKRVLLETHGSWGDGLKLQAGKQMHANRSYISLGGLQERLDKAGVKECIISACNSGRLYRPVIYRRLDTSLLLPANRGIFSASRYYHPKADSVKILRRRESRFEALTPLFVAELPQQLRRQLGELDNESQMVVSDLFLEYVLNDPNLNLIEGRFVHQISIRDYSINRSEALIKRFFEMLNQIAACGAH